MAKSMKEISKKTKDMEMEYSDGEMVVNMMVSGRMGSNMEEEYLDKLMDKN
jgi:hypothetical protein